MIDTERIAQLVDASLPDLIDIRHQLHAHPEIANQEHLTATVIRQALEPTSVNLLKPFLGTDVVGLLDGNGPGKHVALRADIDALPLQEATGLPYASKHPGLMHACGHDGHTAILIGVARVLTQLKDTFNGSVRFVFQPGEEVAAAGKDLVEKGALLNPEPDAVFALHGWHGAELGHIASRPGIFLGAADFFKLVIQGKGAHGSMPEDAVNPLVTGARLVEALSSIPAQHISALQSAVVSVCRFTSGLNSNVIPDQAELRGTTRYLKPEIGDKIEAAMKRIVAGICDSAGASYDFAYHKTYIPTVNAPEAVALGKRVTREVLGPDHWVDQEYPSMGSEDFSYYLVNYPGAMFQLGLGKDSALLHNPHFDFNDDAIRNGAIFLVNLALAALAEP